jgi:hypothetical protein
MQAQKIMMQAQNAKIEELEKNFDTKFEEVNSKISKVETTVQELKTWKMQLLGGFLALGSLMAFYIGWYTFFGSSFTSRLCLAGTLPHVPLHIRPSCP